MGNQNEIVSSLLMPHWTFKAAAVITPETDFLGDSFAMAWAGWKFTGCLFFALTNVGVDLAISNSIAMAIYVAFDIFAVADTDHWTPAAYGFIALDGAIVLLMIWTKLKAGGQATCGYTVAAVINFLYVLAGCALFATGTAPVITPETDFLGDSFSTAWAGWKFSRCLFFAMVNWGVPLHLCNFVAMLLYTAFDVFAVIDTAHWTVLAYGFILMDGGIGLTSILFAPKGVVL